MTEIQLIKQQREDLIIEEQLWDVLKKYPKLSISRAIYILAGMIKYLSSK